MARLSPAQNDTRTGPMDFGQGVVLESGGRRVVMVNQEYTDATVIVEGTIAGCYALVVDLGSGEGPPRKVDCSKDGSVLLGPYASAVVYLS